MEDRGPREISSHPALDVLAAFTRLGLTCFGGPVAHIGYFRQEFVVKRRWLDERAFADLAALCQFLPGPASSQAGFGLGLMGAGPLGALAAWLGFTAPSAILMVAFAFVASALYGPLLEGLTHGLKLVAVAVVAQAVVLMARSLTPDAPRAVIAAIAIVLFSGAFAGQAAAIGFGALAGYVTTRGTSSFTPFSLPLRVRPRAGLVAFALFASLLVGAVLAPAAGDSALSEAAAFYRSGALVFGGGHVVLPLLQRAVVTPHWVSQDTFLAGYGGAQALPGPLFTFAAYLGAVMEGPPSGVLGALIALAAIFLPGLLALIAALPFWSGLRQLSWAQGAMRGANAAVVGVLSAALYNPLWTSAVHDLGDLIAAAAAFILLIGIGAAPLVIVSLGAAFGLVRAFL
jgi:chromate transporter